MKYMLLLEQDIIFLLVRLLQIDGNPTQTISSVVYDEYDGAFFVDTVISPLEFTYKVPSAALTESCYKCK